MNLDDYIKDRADYISQYINSEDNAATASEVDANANSSTKNVATLESELYKKTNILISRYRVREKLKELYGEDAPDYESDLESRVIYKHDENSSPAIKPYCVAVNMYPFLLSGTSGLDGLRSTPPKNLNSFCGQFCNLVFLISSQFQGAVAYPELFNLITYYAIKQFGEDFANQEKALEQAFQHIVYSINQPAGNRSFQSPFTNISYFDKYYWESMFGKFVFPDGSKVTYDQVNFIQKKFMKWLNVERTKSILTFPVETVAMLHDGKDIIDQDWKSFTAEMYSEGHSFFTYISDNADSLSSCCFDGEQKVLVRSSNGVHLLTFKDLNEGKYKDYKKNMTIFHNGSWVKGKETKTSSDNMYEITTVNNKKIIVTNDHLHPTTRGDIPTDSLSTEDYILFSTKELDTFTEKNLKLSYQQGVLIGAYLGDGSIDQKKDSFTPTINFSLNEKKYCTLLPLLKTAVHQLDIEADFKLGDEYNNVYPLRISSNELKDFIKIWTSGNYSQDKQLNLDCLLQSIEFRKGILDGYYMTDGGNSNRIYTTSKYIAEQLEILIVSLGKVSIIDLSDRTDETIIIRGEEFKRNFPLYCIRWYEPKNRRTIKDIFKVINNSTYFKIKSINKLEKLNTDVYCFEMENDDEPYFTLPNGIITHNCRLRNAITPEFSFTSGNIGVATGSKSVITININRLVQSNKNFRIELILLLERIYKYHKAYNELLKDLEKAQMLPVYSEGYISLNQQFLTIGLNGINEAALYLGIEVSDNKDYEDFCRLITETISEQNRLHSTRELKFNTEFVPAEGLGIKNYDWDKADGYVVPEGRNCYTSYFYLPDNDTSVLEKFRMHSKRFTDTLDGGVALHCNLDEHLTKTQYEKLINYAIEVGTNYFTFNIPNSECEDCGFISKSRLNVCPKCGSSNITLWDRIIGYLRPIKNFSKGRRIEALKRKYISL